MKDDALVAAARTGDRRAIGELLAKYEQPIYRFGLRMCGDEESAREVLQETMLAAFKNLPGFRGDAALSTWLYQIARSFCIKERRGVRPHDRGRRAAPRSQRVRRSSRSRPARSGRRSPTRSPRSPASSARCSCCATSRDSPPRRPPTVVGIEVGALKSRLHRARLALRAAARRGARGRARSPARSSHRSWPPTPPPRSIRRPARRIEAHLAGCARCTGACDSLKRTVSLCRSHPRRRGSCAGARRRARRDRGRDRAVNPFAGGGL